MWLPQRTARVIATACRWPPERALTFVRTGGSVTPKRSKASRSLAPHRGLVEAMEHPARGAGTEPLAAQEEILRDVQRRDQRKVLEDGLDPDGARLGGIAEAPLHTVDQDLTLIGPDAPETTPTSVLLPAPLSPMSPSTCPRAAEG